MKGLSIFVSCFLFVVAPWLSRAEQHGIAFNHITVDKGLSNNYVESICQDKEGYIWIGTNNGVNKFNGYDIKIYKHDLEDDQSIQSNIINFLYADKAGCIWACTANGLSWYDASLDCFRRVELPETHSIENIVQLSDSLYLVSTRNISFYYNHATGALRNFTLDGEPVRVYSFSERDGTLLVGTMEKTVECLWFDGTELKRKYAPIKTTFNAASVLLADGSSGWGGYTKGGVFSIDFKKGEILPVDHLMPPTESVEAIIEDGEGRLWLGAANALYIYDHSTGERFRLYKDSQDHLSLSFNCVKSLFRDASGGIWVGTEYGGVNYWNGRPPRFSTLKTEKGESFLWDKVVTTLCPGEKEEMWIGTRNQGLYHHDRKTGRTACYPIDNIRSVYQDPGSGLVYVGTSVNGWRVLNRKTGAVKAYDVPSDVNSIIAANDHKIWLGSLSGLYLYDPAKDRVTKIVFPGEGIMRILTLFKDASGRLWIGAKESLRTYRVSDDNALEEVTPEKLKNIVRVNGLYEARDTLLWIGSSDGLYAYQALRDSVYRETEVSGLRNTAVNGIEADTSGNLWIGTGSGLVRFSPSEQKGRTFYVQDGLCVNQFSAFSCHFRDSDGRLYFGGVGGVVVFTPEAVKDETRTTPPVITSLRLMSRRVRPGDSSGILGNAISRTDKITLRHYQNNFTLSFACPDYVSNGRNRFVYKMEGADKNWIPARTREVVYSHLDQGDYTFRLKACNMDGVWDPGEAVLSIRVLPVWYKSIFFRISITVLLLFLLVVLEYRLYVYFKQKQEKKLEGISIEYEERLKQSRVRSFVPYPYFLKDSDAALLGTVIDEIDNNITNPQFSVASLAERMGITRATLHKRVKALTGLSPVELVRTIRIQKACDLLKEKKYSVADVAEQTGFNSVSYFISSFKQVVGRTPGDY